MHASSARRWWFHLAFTLCCGLCTTERTPAYAQGAAEDAAFQEARAKTDAAARIEALEAYTAAYPAGQHHTAAQELLLQTYLNSPSPNLASIHAVAHALVNGAAPGIERWTEEQRVAMQLADAGTAGVDLRDARSSAEDAVQHLTEEGFRRDTTATQIRYKLPRLTPKQLHLDYVGYRAAVLAALADVDLREHQLQPASALLAEAFRLQPLSGDVNRLRGELALAQGDKPTALQSLERADALGSLREPWRAQELQLFNELTQGDATALDARVDELYRALYPVPFHLPPRRLQAGGHTALLELFTGSGCLPCAGPDLAVDSLLGSYSRHDLIVLAFDQHIPRPDPLANSDSVQRAGFYGAAATPLAFLDGQPLDVLGASRQDVENIVIGFADQVEQQAALPSGAQLRLAVQRPAAAQVTAQLTVTATPAATKTAPASTGDVSLRSLSQDVVSIALVQDNVRYGGENGIRFHRMVVRSLLQTTAAAYLTGAQPTPVSFDVAALDRAQQAYLTSYEQKNDRFGTFKFLTKDLPIAGGELAVVAWVQNPKTHEVLETVFAPVPAL